MSLGWDLLHVTLELRVGVDVVQEVLVGNGGEGA